ncbi:hypothetical protein OUK_1076 [Helicobacter pylori R037c]|nr:hypothetical protein OUK_1076 [Helicobacter pylori R037c]
MTKKFSSFMGPKNRTSTIIYPYIKPFKSMILIFLKPL